MKVIFLTFFGVLLAVYAGAADPASQPVTQPADAGAVAEPPAAAPEDPGQLPQWTEPSARYAPIDRHLIPLPRAQADSSIDSRRANQVDNRVDNKVLSAPLGAAKPSKKSAKAGTLMPEDDGIDVSLGRKPPSAAAEQRDAAKSIAEYYQRNDTSGKLRPPVETYGNGYVTSDTMGNRIRVQPRGTDSFDSIDSLGNRTRIYRSPRGGYETIDSLGNRKAISEDALSGKAGARRFK